jgi:hypothetical protein
MIYNKGPKVAIINSFSLTLSAVAIFIYFISLTKATHRALILIIYRMILGRGERQFSVKFSKRTLQK